MPVFLLFCRFAGFRLRDIPGGPQNLGMRFAGIKCKGVMKVMNSQTVPRNAAILRWIARLWTIPVFALTLIMIFSPDPNMDSSAQIPFADWFLLSFWAVAVLGLALAWRWERAGGTLTITIMFLRELAWIILKGGWVINFLIFWALVATPAILFLIAGSLKPRTKKA
jgi:hypothetical protein